MEAYRDNEPVALNQMKDALRGALSPLMHDIRNEEHYDAIMTLCNVLNRKIRGNKGLRNTAWNRFVVRQQIALQMDAMISSGDPKADRLISSATSLADQCRRLRIDEKLVAEHWCLSGTLLALMAVALPIVAAIMLPPVLLTLLFCLVCYPIALIPTHLVVKKKIKDPQFRSSVNWGVRFFLSILYTIIIGIVMACCHGAWMAHMADIGVWWGLVAVAVVIIGAYIVGPIVNFFRDLMGNIHYWSLRLARRREMDLLDGIIREMTECLSDGAGE